MKIILSSRLHFRSLSTPPQLSFTLYSPTLDTMSAASEEKDAPAAPYSEADLIKEDTITASDNDATEPERPVRRKLQETRITSEGNPSIPDDDVENDDRGRLKKRSHDDLQAEEGTAEQQTDSGHRRKRSRDANDDDSSTKIDVDRTTTPEPTANKDDASAHILSPKKKRSLDQLQGNGASAQSEQKASIQEIEKERETKRHRDASQDRQAAADGGAAPVKVIICSLHSIIQYLLIFDNSHPYQRPS